jgi:hypothetical protein
MPKNSTAKPATEHSRDLLAQMTHRPNRGTGKQARFGYRETRLENRPKSGPR